MEKRVTRQSVLTAIKELEAQGEKVSQRKIRALLGGGSPNEIIQIIREIESEKETGVIPPSELSDTISRAILGEIAGHLKDATRGLRFQVDQARHREAEAVSELSQAIAKMAEMDLQLGEANMAFQLARQELQSFQVALQEKDAEIQRLAQEAERARTEVALLKQQLSHQEAQASLFANQLSQERTLRTNTEKTLAATEQRLADREETLNALQIKYDALLADIVRNRV